MNLERHLTRDQDIGVYFGNHEHVPRWDYEWFIGETSIGVMPNPADEAEQFSYGFLVTDDKLVITPDKRFPTIKRDSNSFVQSRGKISVRGPDIEEVLKLIELFESNSVLHAYLLSEFKDGSYPGILTFSPQAPPEDLYKPGTPMTVEFVKR